MYESYDSVTIKWIHSQISPDGKTICVLSNIMDQYNLEFYDLTRFNDNKPYKLALPLDFYNVHKELGIDSNSYEDHTDFLWNEDNTFTYKIRKEYCHKFRKYNDFLTNKEINKLPVNYPLDDEDHTMRDLIVRHMRKVGNDMVVFNETMTPYYDIYNMQKETYAMN